MIYTQTYSYVLSSPKKLALVAKLISGQSVEKAMQILKFLPNKAALTVSKVLKHAINNFKQTYGVETKASDVFIQRYDLGPGPKLRRVKAVGRGRMYGYVKHRAFFALHLAGK